MRFLHLADLHIGKNLGEYSLLDDQEYMLDRVAELAQQEGIEAIVVAGDLYQRSIPSSEAVVILDQFLYRVVEEIGIPVLAIAGNHDSPQRLEFGSTFYKKSHLYIAGTFQKTVRRVTLCDAMGEVVFYLLPYVQPEQVAHEFDDTTIRTFNDAYNKLLSLPENKPDLNKRNVLIAHGFFVPFKEGVEVELCDSERMVGGSEMIDVGLLDDYDYVALGHLHAPQQIGRKTVRYSGSLLKYSISESAQNKSITVVDVGEKGKVDVKALSIKSRRDLRVIKGRLKDIINQAKTIDQNNHDFVFAQLEDDLLFDAMGQLRAVFPYALGLNFKNYTKEDDSATLSSQEIEDKSIEHLFATFYEELKGEAMTEEQTLVIETLVKAIEKEEK